uniref:Sodium-coupled monocarboxylate transporter 1-like n=1 Tax=Gouania willdenowi TaxID=441366 RepID=A0A8C5E2C1_GOUWI
MSGDAPLRTSSFVMADYVVFALMLGVSAAVGVYYACVDKSPGTSGEFLTGGRRLTALPVSLSLTASFMSAITVLSNPAEVYRYGAILGFYTLSYLVTMLVTSELFLPVFYKLAITSTYEYLELRFNRATRLLGTMLFIVQTILYTGIVIYAPALALNQVTGMNLWGAVISTGVVCTFYCTVGGLKAVVWTDLGVMMAGFLSVIVRSVVLQGGVMPIISDSQRGGRLNVWDFDTNPLRRHTFWTVTVGGSFVWISIYGINQAQVQRYISCKSLAHARLSLYINLFGLWSILLCSVFAGMCLYSVYKHCDPWSSGQVSASDQLMPYLVMDIFRAYPGLPGLFVAAAYSGSLRSLVWVSMHCNGRTGLINGRNSTGKHLVICYCNSTLLVCFKKYMLSPLVLCSPQAAISIFGIIGGPLLGLFTLGILCPWANSKGALSGLVSGLVVSLWVGIGAQIYPPPPEMTRPLPLSTTGCSFNSSNSFNWTSLVFPTLPVVLSPWYSLSYLYFSPLGTLISICIGLLVSVFTGTKHLYSGQKSRIFQLDVS